MSINRDWRESDSLPPSLFSKKSHFGGADASSPTLHGKERGVGDNEFPAPVFTLQIFGRGGGCAHMGTECIEAIKSIFFSIT